MAFAIADVLLQQDMAISSSEKNQHALANLGTTLHFTSLFTPLQGGLCEAAVKSAKYHLIHLVSAFISEIFMANFKTKLVSVDLIIRFWGRYLDDIRAIIKRNDVEKRSTSSMEMEEKVNYLSQTCC